MSTTTPFAISGTPQGCTIEIVAFDFAAKRERPIGLDELSGALNAGSFAWVDIGIVDAGSARSGLENISWLDPSTVVELLEGESGTYSARDERYLHLALTGCRLTEEGIEHERLDVFLGADALLTLHQGPVLFLDRIKAEYRVDFEQHAKSSSYLLYEVWDHLLKNYLNVHDGLENRVDRLQQAMIGDVDEDVFKKVSDNGKMLLHLRKILLQARGVLGELVSRKSRFVSEATQPYLHEMQGAVERLLQDIVVDRDILSDTLNMRMSIVNHRTNEVVKRLTVVSIVFLPLTFLCGVYGMNFEFMPELDWRLGYGLFWVVVVLVTFFQILILKKKRMLD